MNRTARPRKPQRGTVAPLPGSVRYNSSGALRCMAAAEGYVMVRSDSPIIGTGIVTYARWYALATEPPTSQP